MKKLSLFSSLIISTTTCSAFVPLISSCSNNNEFKVNILNSGHFDLSQRTILKGKACELLVDDKNTDETIAGVKSIKSHGKEIDNNK